MDQRTRCMQFLYNWVSKGHTSNLRKGMVEELQAFINAEIAQDQANKTAARIEVQQAQEAASQEPQGSKSDYPNDPVLNTLIDLHKISESNRSNRGDDNA